jgi:hypothetical protein
MTLSECVNTLGLAEFKARLIAELKSLAETHKDFCYVTDSQIEQCRGISPKCSYAAGPQFLNMGRGGLYAPFSDNTEEQNKGCIFGRALAAMGVDLADQSDNISSLLKSAGVDDRFRNYCWDVQSEQDSGRKWGELKISSLEGV